jgi:glutamyl-tRNA reductase
MAGIDHTAAALGVRERLSFTSRAMEGILLSLKARPEIEGSVLLSTCNRTELWLSYPEGGDPDAARLLCEAAGEAALLPLVSSREGADAAMHLFRLACGMESMIFGEKQILSQAKKAAAFSRSLGASGAVLESLFNKAVDAAKKVATNVRLSAANASAAEEALRIISESSPLSDAKVLVIGNGEMGRLAAASLVSAGAKVKMTLRAYKNGESILPFGCEPVPYEERISHIGSSDAVVSATASPHYTIHAGDLSMEDFQGAPKPFIDLAVPRDIDPAIGAWEGVRLYDIDSLSAKEGFRDPEAVAEAESILSEELGEFSSWYHFRSLVPLVNEIAEAAAGDVDARTQGKLRSALGEEGKALIERDIHSAVAKVVSRLMFGFKDHLRREHWEECLDSMKKTLVEA